MDKKISVINGLRGYAILGVIFHHFRMFYKFAEPGWQSVAIGNTIVLPFTVFSNGWLGVNLFFVLSGFVLYLPYAQGKRSFDRKEDVIFFYKKRAIRLLPLYLISGLLFLALSPIGGKIAHLVSYVALLLTVTFPFTKMTFLPKFNPILWAIGLIIWFSLLFPFIVRSCKKIGTARTFLYALVVSLAVRLMGVSIHFFDIGNPYVNVLKDSIFGRIDDFILGMLICEIYCRNGEHSLHFMAPGTGLVAGMLFTFTSSSLWDYVKLGVLPESITPLINNVLQMGLFFLILALLYIKNGMIKSFFSNYLIQLTGMISYSLVIWHYPLIPAIVGRNFDAAHVAVYLVFLFILSLLTFRYIEFGEVSEVKMLFGVK